MDDLMKALFHVTHTHTCKHACVNTHAAPAEDESAKPFPPSGRPASQRGLPCSPTRLVCFTESMDC